MIFGQAMGKAGGDFPVGETPGVAWKCARKHHLEGTARSREPGRRRGRGESVGVATVINFKKDPIKVSQSQMVEKNGHH
jgi:hypothetical protein